MADKALAISIIAVLISAGSIAYSNSVLGGISGQIDQAKKDLMGQVSSQATQVTSKISPLETSVSSVRQEQTAIRSLVEQRIGGLEKSLQDAQSRLAQAEKQAQQSQQELQALQAERALEDAAKKEKAPLVYGSIDAPHFLNILWPRFRESYPWAPAEGKYIEGFGALRSRFISEHKSGVPSADLLLQAAQSMRGDMPPYMAPYTDMKYMGLYTDDMVFPSKSNPLMFATALNGVVIVYNSNIVEEKDAPKGWLDLASSKWKGKIVMQTPITLGSTTEAFSQLLVQMGQDKWNAYMKGVAANSILTGSSSEAYTKVVAGEFPLGLALLNDIMTQKAGTPVKVAWPKDEPLGVPGGLSNMVGISSKASNPNFAKLFVQWLLSPAGQRAVGETGRFPAMLTLDHPNSLGKVFPSGVKLFPQNQDYVNNPKNWEGIMKSFFG